MVIVQVRQEHDVGWVVSQYVWGRVLSVTLQKEYSISEDGVGQHADAANVHQNGGVSNIVYFSQMITLSWCFETAALANRPRRLYLPFDLLSIHLSGLTGWRPERAKTLQACRTSGYHYTWSLLTQR